MPFYVHMHNSRIKIASTSSTAAGRETIRRKVGKIGRKALSPLLFQVHKPITALFHGQIEQTVQKHVTFQTFSLSSPSISDFNFFTCSSKSYYGTGGSPSPICRLTTDAATFPSTDAELDAQLLRLTNALHDAVEPHATAILLSHAFPLAGGGRVVVLRVGVSPNAPHRAIRGGQFFLRNFVVKEPMDIQAIRTAFAYF
jgi:hypothetical protein